MALDLFELGMTDTVPKIVEDTDLLDSTETDVVDSTNTEDPDGTTDGDLHVDALSDYETALQSLSQSGVITELPEGIENVDNLDDYNKVVEHNLKLRDKEIRETVTKEVEETILTDLRDRLDPLVLDLMNFNIKKKNGGGNVIEYAKSLLYAGTISNLDETDPIDAEEIITQYYTDKGLSKEDINDNLELLKSSPDKLLKKAAEFKPKVIEAASSKAKKQTEDQQAIAKYEEEQLDNLNKRVVGTLKNLKIKLGEDDELPLTQKEAEWLHNAIVNDNTTIVIKGKKREVTVAEALIHALKYDEKGDLNVLMAGLLTMIKPEKLQQHYQKKAIPSVVKEIRSSQNNNNIQFKKREESVKKKKVDSILDHL